MNIESLKMNNKKFYYVCNLDTKIATDYRQLPEVWGPISGMQDCSDTDIADLSWAGVPNIGWLDEAAAISTGISQASLLESKILGANAIREAGKVERQLLVDAIIVTTASGKQFNGDETSQNRMARGILGLQAAGIPTVTWVLADNTAVEVTASELGEALALSGAAQAAIWVINTV